jgi:hypothetical protein
MTKGDIPISFRPSEATDAIIDEILRQHPDLEGNRSAAIRVALYDWQERNAPDLLAPET